MYSAVPDMKLQCMFGLEDKLENIKVASLFTLFLENTAANMEQLWKQQLHCRKLQLWIGDKITSRIILAGFNRHHNEELVELSKIKHFNEEV